MRKYLLAGASLIALSSTAQAIPIPGMNTFETQCASYRDGQIDPIKEPGVFPSAHMHTHYGFTPDQNFDAKAYGDSAQVENNTAPRVQNIPQGTISSYKDPGYPPLVTTCSSYGDWAWYAIPSPRIDGWGMDTARDWTWWDGVTPRVVSNLRNVWASPKGIDIFEPPFGMTFIVGDPHTASEAEMSPHVWYTCGDVVTKSKKPRDCSGGMPGIPATPEVNPFPNLLMDYQMKADAVAAAKANLDMVIMTKMNSTIMVAAHDLTMKVQALQAAAMALEAARITPANPGTSGMPGAVPVPAEWGYSPRVTGVIEFPDCWDGMNAYPNFDHQTGIDRKHFYYSTNGSCGAGHMVTKLFMLVYFIDPKTSKPLLNPLNPDGSVRLTFASGPYYTLHADFANWWDAALGYITAGCLNRQRMYGQVRQLDIWNPGEPCSGLGATAIQTCPAPAIPGNPYAPEGLLSCRDATDTPVH